MPLVLGKMRKKEKTLISYYTYCHKRIKLCKQLQYLSPELLNVSAAPDAWNILDILTHLYDSERLALIYLKKKLSYDPELPSINWRSFLSRVFLFTYLHLPFKFKAPKIVDPKQKETVPHKSLTALSDAWQSQSRTFEDFFSELDEALFDKKIFRHPFGGLLSLLEMCLFFNWHFDRHRKQLDKILRNFDELI